MGLCTPGCGHPQDTVCPVAPGSCAASLSGEEEEGEEGPFLSQCVHRLVTVTGVPASNRLHPPAGLVLSQGPDWSLLLSQVGLFAVPDGDPCEKAQVTGQEHN